jgi:hypothetical protein
MNYDASAYRSKLGKGFKKLPAAKVAAWIEQNFEFKTRKGGSEYCINSPFDGDTGHNFNINPENGVCNDWRGNEWAGPINPETNRRNCSFIKFVRLYRKFTYREALKEILGSSTDLSSYLRPEGRVTDGKAQKKITVALPDGTEILATSINRQATILIRWLGTRGYTEEDIERNELHHLGMDVYWPYYEFDTLVYWQSRSRLNKRFNFPDIQVRDKKSGDVIGETEGSKGDFLYGFDDVEPASYIIITEAIFDKHTLRDQTLASGGAILTPRQIGKIRILGPKQGIILSPDNDSAGIKSIITNQAMLHREGFTVFCSIPPKLEYTRDGETFKTKDWNEIGENVSGFDKVRDIHDDGIKKLTPKELVRLRQLLVRR